jgi:F0F1-type ATP synthase membrane subunit b/b'
MREGQGILEYLLMIIIVVLFVLIIAKLFGPAISNFIQELLQNVQ